jgi:hypothetical protein
VGGFELVTGPSRYTLGPGIHVAQTGVLPMTGLICDEIT